MNLTVGQNVLFSLQKSLEIGHSNRGFGTGVKLTLDSHEVHFANGRILFSNVAMLHCDSLGRYRESYAKGLMGGLNVIGLGFQSWQFGSFSFWVNSDQKNCCSSRGLLRSPFFHLDSLAAPSMDP